MEKVFNIYLHDEYGGPALALRKHFDGIWCQEDLQESEFYNAFFPQISRVLCNYIPFSLVVNLANRRNFCRKSAWALMIHWIKPHLNPDKCFGLRTPYIKPPWAKAWRPWTQNSISSHTEKEERFFFFFFFEKKKKNLFFLIKNKIKKLIKVPFQQTNVG